MEQELEQQQPQPQFSRVDELKERVAERQQRLDRFKERQAQLAAVEEAAAKNPTFLGEVGKAVWGAGVDLVTETTIVAKDAARYILPVDKLILGFDGRADEASKQASSAIRGAADQIAPDNETLLGSGARGIMQFMVPYVGWAKAAGQATTLASMTGRGFAIDMALFNPNEGNLSSLIKQLAPEHQNVVLDFLATDPDDDEALNRLRNGLEGAVLGTALEGVFRVARWATGKAKIDKAHEAADELSTDISDLKGPVEPDLPVDVDAPRARITELGDDVIFETRPGTEWDSATKQFDETGIAPLSRGHTLRRAEDGTVDLYDKDGQYVTGGFDDFADARANVKDDFGPETLRRKDSDLPPREANEPRLDGDPEMGHLMEGVANADDARVATRNWGGVLVDDMNSVDRLFVENLDEARKLYDASAGLRDHLRAKYGDTVVLYRGQATADIGKKIDGKAKPTLYVGDLATARKFAGRKGTVLQRIEVDVDDIIVGTKTGNYSEFMIRNPDAPEIPAAWRKQPEATTPQGKQGAPDGEAAVKAERNLDADLRSSLKITAEQRATLNRLLVEGDDEAVAKMLQKDFNLDTIDWSKIESADDIRKLITVTSEVLADHIDDVKGGVQSHVQTKRLANLVGLSGEQVFNLTKELRGDKGIAARFHAAQRTLLASAREVFRLRDVAKAAPGDLAAKAALLRQIELHAALQAQVKGAQTEIARALNGMQIIKAEAEEGFKEFDTLMRSMGGPGKSGKDFERLMDDLLDAKSLEDLNAKIRDISGAERFKNVVIEYTINAMLSSPKTHIINFTSNVLNTFLYSGDRLISGAYRRMVHGDKAAWREAKVDLMRKFSSLDEAFKLARQAWKDGAPVTDKRQRLEFQTRKAIAMDGNSALAKTVNVIGTVVRVPGRLLITGDEFFKAINRNAEISVLAYRKADELATAQGLEIGTSQYEGFVQRAMKTLMDPETTTPAAREIRSKAIEKSRLVTFQEAPRTGGGQKLEAAINANAFVKLVIAPFFRTPMNILRQGIIDRTPLGLILKDTRDVVFRGNPKESAEAVARMTTGVAAMAGFWAFTGTDDKSPIQIIGKVPFDSSAKANGVLDYSIRIGDRWFQFNRLDPLGMWLGMVADARMHTDHADDDEKTFALIQGAMAGFMNNVTNKTWAKSLSDLYELMDGLRSNEPAAVDRAVAKFTSGEFGKLIPQLVKSVGKVALDGDDRFAKEAWTFFDGVNAQLPVLNRDVPNRHDVLGRPITWANSAASILNPFAVSDNPSTPLDKEMQRLAFTVRPMPKSLGGGMMDLSAEEYSKLTGLVGEVKVSRHGNLEATLNELVTSEKYAEWSDERKVFMVKKYIENARGMARVTMLTDPAMKKRLLDAKLTELSALISTE